MIYTGIGSRETPESVLVMMTTAAQALDEAGWTLRSGGAPGADSAFEKGVTSKRKEIYLPWPNFNGNNSPLSSPSPDAIKMASELHPNWLACSQGARKLHGRNCHQILGENLATPSDLVICWTKYGQLVGGTAMALRLAMRHNVRIINLGTDEGVIALLGLIFGKDRVGG